MEKVFDAINPSLLYGDNQAVINGKNHNSIVLLFDYTKGDETQLEFLVELGFLLEDNETVEYFPTSKFDEDTGAIENDADLVLSATGKYYLEVEKPVRAFKVRVSVKRIAGVAPGTITMRQTPDNFQN